MKLFNKKQKPLSEYEKDAMWMSCRYAIGRHTIACVEHSGEMVQAVYNRLTDEEKAKEAFDIRRELNDTLWNEFNFRLDLMDEKYFDPFKAMGQLSKQDKVKEIGVLHYLENTGIIVKVDEEGKYIFEETKPLHYEVQLYPHNLHDLLEWANAANALDMNKHFIADTEYDNKKEKIEVFERYNIKEEDIYYDVNFYVEYTDINTYLWKPGVFCYIRKECIKDIKPIKC